MLPTLGSSLVVASNRAAAAVIVGLTLAAAPNVVDLAVSTVQRLLVELSVLRMHVSLLGLTDQGTGWWSVQSEVRVLLGLEKQRRLHALEQTVVAAAEARSGRFRWRVPWARLASALPRLRAPAPAAMPASDGGLIFKDLVLVGGGHSHAHVLKMWGMNPEPGVQLTLVTRDVDTPYSGMLPGYVAGSYTWRECHIDLAKLAAFAGARLIHAEACGLDTAAKQLHLRGRPPIAYDVISIDIGSAPKPVSSSPAGAARPMAAASESVYVNTLPTITPVKPIDGFCKRWDRILQRVLSMPDDAAMRIAVVGAGAGGVELALSMERRFRHELTVAGRSTVGLQVGLRPPPTPS